MSHIVKKASVRDLRYRFHEIEVQLNKGEEIEVYKRRKMIGRLVPAQPRTNTYPDFSLLRRSIFGGRKARKTATDLVAEERGYN
jgi:antitoxin (DNA-binding transcriptional repressor) of toxin-antitoxin stability system